MLFDGLLALVTGSYIAPGGQLGPWQHVVSALGIAPLSAGMKTAFVVLGAAYIASAAAYAFYKPRGTLYLAAAAVLTLWYLPLGTILSLVVLISIAVDSSRMRRLRI